MYNANSRRKWRKRIIANALHARGAFCVILQATIQATIQATNKRALSCFFE